MNNESFVFLSGIAAGTVLTALITSIFPTSYVNRYHQELKKVEICQEKLPRNEKCVLTAVPENKDAK